MARCQEDAKRMPRGCQEDAKRMPRGMQRTYYFEIFSDSSEHDLQTKRASVYRSVCQAQKFALSFVERFIPIRDSLEGFRQNCLRQADAV